MNVKVSSLIAILISLYTLIVLNSFFRWILPNDALYVFFAISICGLTFYSHVKNVNLNYTKNRFIIFTLLLILNFHLFSGWHSNSDLWLGRIVSFVPLLCMVFFDNNLLIKCYKQFKKIIVVVAFFSLLLFIFFLFGINLPYVEIVGEHRTNIHDTYRIYGPVIGLFRDGNPIMAFPGSNLLRSCGIFAEPGHFGIIIAMLLLAEKMNINSNSNKILLLAGFTTFSTAFIFIVLFAFFYKIILDKRVSQSHIYLSSFLLLVTVSLLIFPRLGEEMFYMAIERNLSDSNEHLLANRINEQFNYEYNRFLNTGDVVFGVGRDYSEDLRTSNYKMLIYRYGYLGIFLSILIILFASLSLKNKKLSLLVVLVLFSILAHRYWFMVAPGIYVLMFFVVGMNSTSKKGTGKGIQS